MVSKLLFHLSQIEFGTELGIDEFEYFVNTMTEEERIKLVDFLEWILDNI